MSWNIFITNVNVTEAKEQLEKNDAPQTIKDYTNAGIDALVIKYGSDVLVTISGSGHLFNGEEGNYETTSASLNVTKSG